MQSFPKYFTLFWLGMCLSTALAQEAPAAHGAPDVVLERVEAGNRIEIYAFNKSGRPLEVTLEVKSEFVEFDRKVPVTEIVPPQTKVRMVTLTPEALKEWSYSTKHYFKPYEPPALETSDDPDLPDFGLDSDNASSNTLPPASDPAEEDEKSDGLLGPPLSVDDMPIPRKYYEPPVDSTDLSPISDANVFEIPPQSIMTLEEKRKILVFGQPGCPRCEMARKHFEKNSVQFKYIDVDESTVNKDLMAAHLFDNGFTGGQFIMPVIVVDDVAHYSIKDLPGFLEDISGQ